MKDLIKRCWDNNLDKGPKTKELDNIIGNWKWKIASKNNTLFYQQYLKIKAEYNILSKKPYQIYTNAITTSKMIDTNEITKRLNSLDLLGIGVNNLNIQSDNKEIISKKTK